MNNAITLKTWHIILIAAVAVALVAGGVVIGLNYSRWFGEDSPYTHPNIDPGAQDWHGATLPSQGGENTQESISVPGYPSLTLPADTKNVPAALLNPEGNPCYFIFTLVLEDGEEVLYTSGLVPPGKAIYSMELSRSLSAGEYNAEIRISTFSLADGETPMNGAIVKTVLIVK